MKKFSLDHLGILGSVTCALHCALFPVLASVSVLLPALYAELNYEVDESWHIYFIVFSCLLAVFSLTISLVKHKKYNALGLFTLACTFIVMSFIVEGELYEHIMLVIGGTLIAVSHYVNLRLLHSHVHDITCHH